MSIFKCPICDGKGFVPKSFYVLPGEDVSFADYREMQKQKTMCMSCFGRGIVMENQIVYPPALCTSFEDKNQQGSVIENEKNS